MPNSEILSKLTKSDYLRERLNPNQSDEFYIHLSDLKLAMDKVATVESIRILDFGCGGSPYRQLFPNAEYFRADLADVDDIDFAIPGIPGPFQIAAPESSFDLILSSQVLEHVPEPVHYLQEAKRLLKPGGKFVITTHGIFEDHSCPGDFYRWTDAGLTKALKEAGFSVTETWKITTGPRAALFLLDRFPPKPGRRSLGGLMSHLIKYASRKRRAWWHRQIDRLTSENRLATQNLHRYRLYIGLGLIATK